MATPLRGDSTTALLTNVSAGSATAPTSGTAGFVAVAGKELVRTYLSFTGTVTALVLRLWIRPPGETNYFRAASSTDLGWAPTSAIGREARDWAIGDVDEFRIEVESIAGGGSVTLTAIGVDE